MNAASPLGADGSPWYRHFWPWFIVGLLSIAVGASLVTVWIAFTHRDALVSDDYYEDGTRINRRLERLARAERLGIAATLDFGDSAARQADRDSAGRAPGDIQLTLSGREIDDVAWLRLDLSHPTRAEFDQHVMLARTPDGRFRGRIEEGIAGRWYATIEPAPVDERSERAEGTGQESAWRLTDTIRLPASEPITIGGSSPAR